MSGYPSLDASAAGEWVYPASSTHPVREYQRNICQSALFMNTLVCLPTGLGKTLIAAVVMYNYYRWFPTGKVIFLAPTKPLVTQQINACHLVMGIPEEDIAHLEGTVAAAKRTQLWESRRVFFCTPQTLSNDLANGRCDPRTVVCLVVDEAHRATGQYAYTTIIQELVQVSTRFRVLALSATPGSDAKRVQTVVKNLLISHIELRAEDDPELIQYKHERQVEIVTCEQGTYSGIQAVRRKLNELMIFPLEKLVKHDVIACSSPQEVNFLFVREAEDAVKTAWQECQLDVCTLQALTVAADELGAFLRCRKALCDEGMKAVLELLKSMQTYFADSVCSGRLDPAHSVVSTDRFQNTIELIQRACSDPKYLEKRQPKLCKLKEILCDHFGRHSKVGSSTRALVFTQLRATVHEIKTEIADVPGVAAHEFVGQGVAKSTSAYNEADPEYTNKGLTQADQARVLEAFNNGQYNVLVATSIAEEGLDIAEVDLIVLFESVSSPIRLVQRCGRTGRKRSGKVVMLVGQGTEEERMEKSHDDVSSLMKILRFASKSMQFYAHDPEMIPSTLPRPQMKLCEMNVAEFRPDQVAGGIGQLTKHSSSSSLKRSVEDRRPRVHLSNSGLGIVTNSIAKAAGALVGISRGRTSGVKQSAANPFLANSDGEEDVWLESRRPSSSLSNASTSSQSQRERLPGQKIHQFSLLEKNPHSHSPVIAEVTHKLPSDEDLFGWGLRYPALQSDDKTKFDELDHLDKTKLSSDKSGGINLPRNSKVWSTCSSASLVDVIELADSPMCAKYVHTTENRVSETIPPIAIQLLSPQTSVHTSESCIPRPAFRGVRLRNAVKSTVRSVPFCPELNDSTDSHTDATLDEDDAEDSITEEVGTGPKLHSSILDSDIKPIKRARTGRIVEAEQQDSPLQDLCKEVTQNKSDSFECSGYETECSSQLAAEKDLEIKESYTKESCNDNRSDETDEFAEWQDTANSCCACLGWEPDEDDPIVFCDGLCGSCVHVSCYGLLPNGVPDGEFYCESCNALRPSDKKARKLVSESVRPVCVLCFQAGGLMKRSDCGKWTHPVCILFTPELTISETTHRPDNLADLCKERADLMCRLCRRAGGACVQCCAGECLRAFHPYCAYSARQQMVVSVDPATDHVAYHLFCPKHKDHAAEIGPSVEIASSRVPIRESLLKCEGSHGHNKRTNGKERGEGKQRGNSRSKSRSSNKQEGRTKLRLALQRSNSCRTPSSLKEGNSKQRLRRTSSLSDIKKGSKKIANELKLSTKRTTNVDGLKNSPKRRKLDAMRFFELEADVSGSDSGDTENTAEDSGDDESCISGGFINDGAYTQHESPAGAATQYGMYLAVNNYHMQMQSPDDVVGGRPNISGLVRKRRALQSASPGDSSVSILDDTPPKHYHSKNQSNKHRSRRGESEEEWDAYESEVEEKKISGKQIALGKSQKTSRPPVVQLSDTSKEFLGGNKHESGSRYNNREYGKSTVSGAVPFWECVRKKAVSGDGESSEDSDSGGGIATTTGVTKSINELQKLDTWNEPVVQSVMANKVQGFKRPPLVPIHINIHPPTHLETKSLVSANDEDSIFDWDF